MADKSYVVTAACAVVYNTDRSAVVTVARGGKLPADVDPEQIKLLLERELIAESDGDAGGLQVDPDATPPFPGTDADDADEADTARKSRRAAPSSD